MWTRQSINDFHTGLDKVMDRHARGNNSGSDKQFHPGRSKATAGEAQQGSGQLFDLGPTVRQLSAATGEAAGTGSFAT